MPSVTRREPREFLLDISRLLWRAWRGALPTGIDRVCLEYLAHFGSRSLGVVQFKGRTFVLSPADSDRLFSVLLGYERHSRLALAAAAPSAWARSRSKPPRRNMTYLNVGHTGLHDAALGEWLAQHGVRAVYLIHDLIPITHPQYCRAGEAEKHRERIERALRNAAGIIANSQATLDALNTFAAARSLPLPPAVAIWIGTQRPLPHLKPRHLGRPHFVAVGTIEGRKNHLLLLEAWRRIVAEMRSDAPILLIIGQRGWRAEEAVGVLDDLDDLNDHVFELGNCDDAQLTMLIAGARALLMPSFVEGFGLPVVEALQLGTPVIATDLPVYREVAGDLPIYLRPDDLDGWASVVRDFTSEGGVRLSQKQAAKDYRAPDWSSHFAAVEEWLHSL